MATINVAKRKVVVFSGGSAANSLVDVFNEVIEKNNCALTYVIPISDNGGSSSEILRVFGGPGIGDVRSRLVRLIPPTHAPIRNLFNHRLPPSPEPAATEFLTLLTGTSPLYDAIPTPQAMLIRSILSHLHLEILKRNRPPTSTFNFQSASIGNLFLTGARLFSGSFESAIYLLAIMGNVDESKTAVLPSILSNFSHHISAGLADHTIIVGQNAISHPSSPTALPSTSNHHPTTIPPHNPTIEDATLPGSLPTLRIPNLTFSKTPTTENPLPARITRIWYINPYGQEMRPAPNPKVIDTITSAEAIIYSIGSLYTSIIPSLILQGVGDAISSYSNGGGARYKILILNGSLDRETPDYTASDFLSAITSACIYSTTTTTPTSTTTSSSFPFPNSPPNPKTTHNNDGTYKPLWSKYITHLIHLEGEGVPSVDKEELGRWGVECVRLYGRKGEGESVMKYDGRALAQALGAILGEGRGGRGVGGIRLRLCERGGGMGVAC